MWGGWHHKLHARWLFPLRWHEKYTWLCKCFVLVCVYETLHVCVLTLSCTELLCVPSCPLWRGKILGGIGSWPSVHLFFNEQMATEILWPLNKEAKLPLQLLTGMLNYGTAVFGGIFTYQFTVRSTAIYLTFCSKNLIISPSALLSFQITLLPCL